MGKRKQRLNEDEIVPGMEVGATGGDLGEQDVSHARVTDVEKQAHPAMIHPLSPLTQLTVPMLATASSG